MSREFLAVLRGQSNLCASDASADLSMGPCTVSSRDLCKGSSRGRVNWADQSGVDVQLDSTADRLGVFEEEEEPDPLLGWLITDSECSEQVDGASSSPRPQEVVGSALLLPDPGRQCSADFTLIQPYKSIGNGSDVLKPQESKGSPLLRAAVNAARYCGSAGLPALWAARLRPTASEPNWMNDPMSEQIFADLNSAARPELAPALDVGICDPCK